MRLVDADALKESIRCSDTDEPKVLSPKKLHKVLTEWIDKRPTIEERKTGRWIERGKDMYINLENAREQYKALGYPHRNELKLQCSACNKITMVDESIAYQFCPHCGTDMRERKEDGEGKEE